MVLMLSHKSLLSWLLSSAVDFDFIAFRNILPSLFQQFIILADAFGCYDVVINISKTEQVACRVAISISDWTTWVLLSWTEFVLKSFQELR